MAESKFDLPEDLLSLKAGDEPWSAKEEPTGGNDEEKVFMGFLDESKDQVTSENSIPLSPQWLYVKPSETRTALSGASGDLRAPNSLPHGSIDPIQKEGWRLDGSQDKKDWRRATPEIESSRRWREEERETGLLGRRDRRKEDRRADNGTSRETAEGRALPSSDRWHDVSNRNSGHETRRDSKWSSRWGPEDREKDSRTEKRTDVEKEETHNEKQSFVGSNRAASERETDSRDKWRPRHRQEVQAGGASVYRAAPGFGLDRGRVEGLNVGFAPGRGRSSMVGSPSLSRPSSAGPIGSAPVSKNELQGESGLSAETFLYPRGKLLDVYRRQKLIPSFDTIPDGLEEVPPITQLGSIEPLAFVAPDAEEEAVLKDIWKGKINSSGVLYNSYRDKTTRTSENVTGVGDVTLTQSKDILPSSNTEETDESFAKAARDDACQGNGASPLDGYASQSLLDARDTYLTEGENSGTATIGGMDQSECLTAAVSMGDVIKNFKELGCSLQDAKLIVGGKKQSGDPAFLKHAKFEDIELPASFDISSKLPDDSSSLFDLPSLQEVLSSDEQYLKSNGEANMLERGTPPEELSLYYRDPQGEIQGPFLGVDIISWFDQGFFGTDLPVSLSDAPEGTPFQELGEVMPLLKLQARCASGTSTVSNLETSDASVCSLKAGTPTPASDFNGSAVINDQRWASPEFDGHSVQHVQSIISKHEDPMETPYSEGQSFHDFVGQDKEVMFPGSSSGHTIGKPSGNLHDTLTNPASHHFPANELAETTVPNHKDNKLHPFGLLWSELEGSHLRRVQSSNMSSGIGDQGHLMNPTVGRDHPFASHKQNSFGAMADSPLVGEAWSDSCRRSTLHNPNLLQDAMDARHLSRMEQETNHFDLAEQLMSQQLQKQQFQQQNLLSQHPALHLNGSVLEQLPSSALSQSRNSVHHQQLINQQMSDSEHLLKLQLQHQRQFQLQQHQLQQQQRQQLHHHQMQLQQQQQQQQQSQVQQFLLEQLLHQQVHDPGFGQSQVDHLRANNMLDQVLLRQHVLHELQQHSHPPPRHPDPSLEQLIQTKFGQSIQQEHHNDLLEFLSRTKHGQMLPLEQQLLLQQEQLQARQLSMASRLQSEMEEERRIGGVWSVNETSHNVRTAPGPHQAHSAGVSPLDFYQRQQRTSSYEEQNHLEQNLALQERLQRGLYEPSRLPFERPMSLPGGGSGVNLDVVNALAHAQGLDMRERHLQMHAAGQVGPFSSGIHSHHPQVPNQFHPLHPDTIESHWSESNVQLGNSWIESRIQQLHLEAERQKRESEVKLSSEDLSSWVPTGGNEENSKRVLMDLLHHKLGVHPVQSLEMTDSVPTSSYERRDPSWLFSGSSSSDHSFNLLSDQQAGLSSSFAEGPYGSNSGNPLQDRLVNVGLDEQSISLESSEKLLLRSHSGALLEEEQFFSVMNETAQSIYGDSVMIGNSSVDRESSEGKEGKKGKKRGSKTKVATNRTVLEAQESMAEQARSASIDPGELLATAPIKHTSLGIAGDNMGFCNYEIGLDNTFVEDMSKDRASSILPKGLDNSFLKRPPVSRVSSSHETLSDLASASTVKGKNPMSIASDEGRRDAGGNPAAAQAYETSAAGKKDMRFRRTSSCSDADVLETSFIDMLKSTTKKPGMLEGDAITGASESSDTAQGNRSGKKKGKKGRQIDPTLLGFKVSSNRIMMGEIQRLED